MARRVARLVHERSGGAGERRPLPAYRRASLWGDRTGVLLYFANQGAGQVVLPIIAGTMLFVVAALFGWLTVVHLGLGLPALFVVIAAAATAFAAINACAMLPADWGRKQHEHALQRVGEQSSQAS